MLNVLSSALVLIFGVLLVHGQFEGDDCTRKHDKSAGVCKSVKNCPQIREEYKNGVPLTVCARIGGQLIVCCASSGGGAIPANPSSSSGSSGKRISVKKCEEYEKLTYKSIKLAVGNIEQVVRVSNCHPTTSLIVGGEKTKAGEYPHMAAIGWRSRNGTLEFNCGGSLISDRYVLTAAHCSTNDYGQKPSVVRLGDQNLKTRTDGVTEVDIPIAEFIRHDGFIKTQQYDDIALIKLERRVPFSKNIRPACLWQNTNINTTKTVATGWGLTKSVGSTSDELMKVELDILDNSYCNNSLGDNFEYGVAAKQMCAGVLAGGKDSCQGDSGGPIQVTTPANKCLYHIIGVTSNGATFCGLKNAPAIYTRVSSYIDWIEKKVWV